MKNRTNKLRLYKLYRNHGIWRTAEEQAWLDIVPVGREFGSKDYERLTELDALADAAKAVADRASESIDQTLQFVAESNSRILDMDK